MGEVGEIGEEDGKGEEGLTPNEMLIEPVARVNRRLNDDENCQLKVALT